jgi:NADH-quinone oxidoreductase subunit F
MGYPHPSHPKENPVLSKHFGDPEARTYDGWVKRGGYEGLKKVLTMTPEAVVEEIVGVVGPDFPPDSSGR